MTTPTPNISLNPKFNRREQQLIIKTLLMKIGLPMQRSKIVNIKIPKFGTFHTHKNKKRLNKRKYMKQYNKNNWMKIKQEQLFDINYLLF